MSYPVLARRDAALDDAETTALLRDRLGDGVVGEVAEYGELTVEIAPSAWFRAVEVCRDDHLLAFDLFDCLFGVDAGEDGLDVVVVLYSTSKGRRIMLRTRCDGGRETPVLASVTEVFVGANWHEREAFDMFGIDFDGHPGLLPRILCVENFEGWPLRKEFALASRVAKPWPGVKDPAEPDADGNVVVREPAIGEAPGPSGLDEVIAKQAREANPTPQDEVEADRGSSGGAAASNAASEEPAREEVALDQEVYDRLIADGKSERIARSKAKAAFIKAQRAAAKAEEATASDDSAVTGAGDDAPASPDGEHGGATEGATTEEAAPPPSVPADEPGGSDDGDDAANSTDDPTPSGDGDPADGGSDGEPVDDVDPPADADPDAADPTTSEPGADATVDADESASAPAVDDAAPSAAVTAEATRAEQAAAREARAAREAESTSTTDDQDLEPIPVGSPPPDEASEDVEGAGAGDDAVATDDGPTEASDEAPVTDDPDPAAGTDHTLDGAAPRDAVTDEATDGTPDQDPSSPATHDDEASFPADGPEVDEPGPFGPGSAYPREDGSGPDGFRIKATRAGNVFHTQDSPNWRQAIADVWFDDVDHARAAGFVHWDPYLRTDLDATTPPAGSGPVTRDDPDDSRRPDPTGPTATTADHAVDGDDQVERVADAIGSDHDDGHAGPHGPGSATPGAGGAGPHGWTVKATSTGNLFHTPESPDYDTVQVHAWFVDAAAARAAGFQHWDPQRRVGLTLEEVGEEQGLPVDRTIPADDEPTTDSAAAPDADGADADPDPVGGTLERDGGPGNPGRSDEGPHGFGALDTHEREPVVDPSLADEVDVGDDDGESPDDGGDA